MPFAYGRVFIEGHCKKRGIAADFEIASAATSREEIGNPVHHGTRNKLAQLGISVAGKHAVQVTKRDYEYYDLLLVMDSNNIRNLRRVIGEDTRIRSICFWIILSARAQALPIRGIPVTLK